MTYNSLCLVLRNNGKTEAALQVFEDTIKLTIPSGFVNKREHRAVLLGNRAMVLRDLGLLEESIVGMQEAEFIYRKLSDDDPDKYLDDWAGALGNLSTILADLGNYDLALERIEQAEAIYREIAEKSPDRFRGSWAGSLSSLGNRLQDVGRHEEARQQVELAEGICRELAAAGPDSYRRVWANTLINLSVCLTSAGRYDDALADAQRAEGILAELASARPSAFRSEWGAALSNLGDALAAVGRIEEGLTINEQAERLFRELASTRPASYRPKLAAALGNGSIKLDRLGRNDEALIKARECEGIYRELAIDREESYRDEWGNSLTILSHSLLSLDVTASIAAAERAVSILEDLFARYAQRTAGLLGFARTVLAEALWSSGNFGAATDQAVEALNLLERVRDYAPAELMPRRGVGLSLLALRPGQDQETSKTFAREAVNLIEPHFLRLGRGLEREMKLATAALDRAGLGGNIALL